MVDPIVLRRGTPEDWAAMAQISVDARSRYRAIQSLSRVAGNPPVAEHRFRDGWSVVAITPAAATVGFALMRPLDGLLLLDHISALAEFRGHGLGTRLLRAVLNQAATEGCSAVALTTFRAPRWNGPWFRKFGFVPMPDDLIGSELRTLIEHQSGYLDPHTRETLWRKIR